MSRQAQPSNDLISALTRGPTVQVKPVSEAWLDLLTSIKIVDASGVVRWEFSL